MTAARVIFATEPIGARHIAVIFVAALATVAGVRYGHRDAYRATLRELHHER